MKSQGRWFPLSLNDVKVMTKFGMLSLGTVIFLYVGISLLLTIGNTLIKSMGRWFPLFKKQGRWFPLGFMLGRS